MKRAASQCKIGGGFSFVAVLSAVLVCLTTYADCTGTAQAQSDAGPSSLPRNLPSSGAENGQPDRSPNLGPDTARATFEAARRYAEIAASGGWPHLKSLMGANPQGEAVARLRRRLAAEGYISDEEANSPDWDGRLAEAVKRFQSNTGLTETGVVSRETLSELNVPAAVRARQLETNAKRLLKLNPQFDGKYVDVNIPSASVEAVEGGVSRRRYTAIVGGRRHPSPQIVAKIISIDINPAWTVPSSIIKKELLPKLRRNPNFLSRERIRVLDGKGREIEPKKLRLMSKARAASFTFRQDPGPGNSLGSLRLSMPNKHQVYMHDTPNKELFDRDYRFLSHGCVRVEGVHDLASWLLEVSSTTATEHWDEASLLRKVDDGRSEKLKLDHPVMVIWVYMTAWASPDGVVRFRRDIYGLDAMKIKR